MRKKGVYDIQECFYGRLIINYIYGRSDLIQYSKTAILRLIRKISD